MILPNTSSGVKAQGFNCMSLRPTEILMASKMLEPPRASPLSKT